MQNASHVTACAYQDSVLLGKIHMALLSLLLSDIEVELTNGFSPHLNKSCNFLALLHSVSILSSFLGGCDIECLLSVMQNNSHLSISAEV